MEKISRYLWSTLLFVNSPLTKNSAVDSLCQYICAVVENCHITFTAQKYYNRITGKNITQVYNILILGVSQSQYNIGQHLVIWYWIVWLYDNFLYLIRFDLICCIGI